MKAIQLEKPQSFRTIDIAEPLAPAFGEVLAILWSVKSARHKEWLSEDH